MEKIKLGDLLNFRRGYDLPKKDFERGSIPVISSSGIMGYHSTAKSKSPVLSIGRSGSVGRPFYLETNFFPHNTTLFVDDFKGNDPKYLFYLIESINLDDWKSGTGVPTLNRNHIHPIKVPAYTRLEDQKKIAKVLNDLDGKIELNNQINKELESMAKLVYDYWFVQFDFPTSAGYAAKAGKPDMEGKPYKSSGGQLVYNEVLKREIPEGWGDGKFGDYANVKSGFAFKSKWWTEQGCPVIKIKDITENGIVNTDSLSFVSEKNAPRASKFKATSGDVIIAMTGATIGKFALIPDSDMSYYINQRVGLYDLGRKPIKKLPYLFNSLRQEYFRQKIFQVASGAAQPNISNSQLDNIKMTSPHQSLINLYNTKFGHYYRKILNNQKENQELVALRDWLLPMLMNGQVSVGEGYDVVEEKLGVVAEKKKDFN